MKNSDVLKMLLCSYGYDRNLTIESYRGDYGTIGYAISAENRDGNIYEECNCEGLMFNIYMILSYMRNNDIGFKSDWWNVPCKYIIDDKERKHLVEAWDENSRKIKELTAKNKPLTDWLESHNPCINCTDNKKDHWDNIHYNCELCHKYSCKKLKQRDKDFEEFKKTINI